jgi:hypothetical protein
MLQGDNRVDRFNKWRNHIAEIQNQYEISYSSHSVIFVNGVGHNPSEMMRSAAGKCILFNFC